MPGPSSSGPASVYRDALLPCKAIMLYMGVRITTKGQITVPKAVRDGLGLKPGDEVEFVAESGEYRLRKVLRSNPFTRYRGYLKNLAKRDPDEVLESLRAQ